ncbi:hypothetical protein ACWGI0_02530 [Streptomyces sp. NPDC054802]
MNTAFRPRHFSRVSPYAAIELTISPPVTTTKDSSTDTPMNCQK